MRMRKECNYRLLVARKCLESVFVLLYFPAIVNAQLCRILSPRTTLYHIYMKRHCSKRKLFLRGVPLFVFLYILYILLSFLSLSLPFFLFLFFSFFFAPRHIFLASLEFFQTMLQIRVLLSSVKRFSY